MHINSAIPHAKRDEPALSCRLAKSWPRATQGPATCSLSLSGSARLAFLRRKRNQSHCIASGIAPSRANQAAPGYCACRESNGSPRSSFVFPWESQCSGRLSCRKITTAKFARHSVLDLRSGLPAPLPGKTGSSKFRDRAEFT